MSPSWRDQLRIGLCPDRLIIAGYRRGLRPALARREVLALEARNEPAGWQGALDALPGALAPSGPGRCNVSVILSNHFVRYALLPWSKALETRADWLALARHRFAGTHGQGAADWELRLSRGAARGARIACAVPPSLLAALEERIASTGSALVSVQPYLMAAFNRMRRRIGHEPCWLVLEEPGRLLLALIRGGDWQALRGRLVDGADWRSMLDEVLERESALLGLPEPPGQITVHALEAGDAMALI